ncbi:MAG: PD-(D/E)XK nuclease family protein [Planctomycetes bacterium]|nr:PD-(D/E)XK nuclease family protein [Planctomycetota bacterium]
MNAPSPSGTVGSGLLVARGPRAAEKLLLATLDRLLPGGRAPDLTAPVVVVLPSATLRRQLLRRLGEPGRRTILGLDLVTPRVLATRLLERAGAAARGGGEYFELLLRRLAAEEPALVAELGGFDDGFGLCQASVRDLLSAGVAEVDQAGLAGLEAALAGAVGGPRARGLIRVARRLDAEMKRHGFERSGDLMARAARLLETTGEAGPRCSALLVHGFADAPGLTRRFLRALLARPEACLILDLPPDPSAPEQEAPAARFARRFAAGLGFEVGDRVDAVGLPAHWQAFDAVGREAEVRESAWRIAAEIDAGCAPEDIGLVLRDLEGYGPEIRRQFRELGLPLSGASLDAGLDPRREPVAALLALHAGGGDLALDDLARLWGPGLDRSGGERLRDLLVAGRTLGLADLRALAALDPERALGGGDALALPVRLGLEGEGEAESARRRRLPGAILRRAVEQSRRLLAFIDARPERAPLATWAAGLARAARELLGQDGPRPPAWLDLLDRTARDGADFPIDRAEFRRLFESIAEARFGSPIGGLGRGVQVLGLAQARGLAFRRLHILGLNARVFPALAREDPLLGDGLRHRLRDRLPDLALAAERPDEESYLFAQLMEASGRITLSWMRGDDDGKELARSPFVERLLLADRDRNEQDGPIARAPRILEARLEEARARGSVLSARDRQLLAALEGRRADRLAARTAELDEFLAALPDELRVGMPAADLIATAQGQLIAELDLSPFSEEARSRPSPFMGRVGPDPLLAQGALHVTTLEGLARCPWQSFLRRALRLERMPDPIATPPDIDAILLGNAVHRALEILLAPLAGAAEAPRPESALVEAAIRRAATEECREQGLELAGLVRVLVDHAGPLVERALDLDWGGDAAPRILATEASLAVAIETSEGARDIHFRADRVDRDADGDRGTDYKTGRPLSEHKKAETRRAKILDAILAGSHLQAAAYALALGRGRYLHLDPDLDEDTAVVEVRADDEVRPRLLAALGMLERAWSIGLLPPRLADPEGAEPAACGYCDFQAACIRGDSGARRRLVDLVEREAIRSRSLLADLWDPKTRGARGLAEEEA